MFGNEQVQIKNKTHIFIYSTARKASNKNGATSLPFVRPI